LTKKKVGWCVNPNRVITCQHEINAVVLEKLVCYHGALTEE